MTQTVGWTRADQAELEVLIWHLVEAAEVHQAGCWACYRLNRWCPPLADAFQAVLDWRNRRRLISRAEWLRAERRKSYAPEDWTNRSPGRNLILG